MRVGKGKFYNKHILREKTQLRNAFDQCFEVNITLEFQLRVHVKCLKIAKFVNMATQDTVF